jgi:cobyrinic acid a,c-diamide synthase
MSPGFVIAAPASGNGKTTVTLGLMGALSRRGYRVTPFKVGPDYIDPGFHKAITKEYSYNLDSWLMAPETIRYLYGKHQSKDGISIVEGVMGLFDGHLCDQERGSTAHLSKILDLPVLLVVDCAKMSASAAALVSGFQGYDPKIKFLGVVLNQVNSQYHYLYLKKKIEHFTGLTVWGRLPNSNSFQLKSRHLGLIPSIEVQDIKSRMDAVIQAVEANIDIPGLMKFLSRISTRAHPQTSSPLPSILQNMPGSRLRIGVAKDAAFSFYYQDNLELIEELGVEIVLFSPLADKELPDKLDGLYLGGGFPEIFATQLSENTLLLKKLKRVLANGLPYFAECGGMMYLCNRIISISGASESMVGWFDASCQMTEKLNRFGYIKVTLQENKLFPTLKQEIRAHEFHHSKILNYSEPYLFSIKKKTLTGIKEWQCGLKKMNGVAGYPHFHFYSSPELLLGFLDLCKKSNP